MIIFIIAGILKNHIPKNKRHAIVFKDDAPLSFVHFDSNVTKFTKIEGRNSVGSHNQYTISTLDKLGPSTCEITKDNKSLQCQVTFLLLFALGFQESRNN